jgi:uncharacterized protein YcfJ
MKTQIEAAKQENRDPISGEPGCHPLGTGVGSVTGAATGAVLGAPGGPIGMAVGGVVGAIAGASTGHGIAEELNPTAEDVYWKENHKLQPYYIGDYDYNDYAPAYRMGYEGRDRNRGLSFEESERELASKWEDARGTSRLDWDHARHAVRDGWSRVESKSPADSYITEH